jgi:DNA polymerase
MSTLERRINDPDLPIELRELLAIRLQASTTSTSKYKTLINGVSSDGRLRGCLQFCGAQRTGRWAGRLFQPQNLPRPVLKQDNIDFGIAALKAGVVDLFYDNVMELTSSAIRGCIIAPKDRKLVVSDLSNIEGRAAAYLAGEGWKLQAFRDFDTFLFDTFGKKILDAKGKPLRKGHDLYNLAYAKAFDIPVEKVEDHQRQIGKVMELMLGYEGGVGAFITGAASYGIDLEELGNIAWNLIPQETKDEARRIWNWANKKKATFDLSERAYIVCDSFKRLWREAHPAISGYWPELQQTVVDAINSPGKTFVSRKLKIRRDGAWLRIVLPSGRALCYASPQVENGRISYMGINQYSRKWSRTYTYGGKLFENVCQAFARDVMAYNMINKVKPAGYSIVLTVHDEVITEAPDNDNFSAPHLSSLLASNPPWAHDMPLAAGGFEAYRYKKG